MSFPNTLISAQQLLAWLAKSQAQTQIQPQAQAPTPAAAPVILDCSFDLMDTQAGERAFAQQHLPGALYAHLERDLSAPKSAKGPVEGGRHPLPQREAWAAQVGAWGIQPETPVVVYDAQAGMYAARAWWLLRWIGHRAVAVLDGGLPAWLAAGGSVSSGPSAAAPSSSAAPSYPLGPSTLATIRAEALLASLGQVTVVDARAPERFRGDVEPLDSRAGHIPGARNRFFKENLGPDGCFLPAAALRARFESLASVPALVVHQCGSGVTACHNLLAMEHAGLAGSTLYPGSWSEWSADPSRPLAQG
jgi:thiosulfate/3-mercaptopyruvate sulfurtransferase